MLGLRLRSALLFPQTRGSKQQHGAFIPVQGAQPRGVSMAEEQLKKLSNANCASRAVRADERLRTQRVESAEMRGRSEVRAQTHLRAKEASAS